MAEKDITQKQTMETEISDIRKRLENVISKAREKSVENKLSLMSDQRWMNNSYKHSEVFNKICGNYYEMIFQECDKILAEYNTSKDRELIYKIIMKFTMKLIDNHI